MNRNDATKLTRAIERVICEHLIIANKMKCESSRKKAFESIIYWLRDAKEIITEYPKYKGKYLKIYNEFSNIYHNVKFEDVEITDDEEKLQKYDELLAKRRQQQCKYNLKYAMKHKE